MTISTSVHSNAFNFMSFHESGVDPRTGQYKFSITLPEVKANDLQGPEFPLTLVYNPLNTEDSGFGYGWTLQLTQYTLGNQVLSLSAGESFKVTGSANGQLVMQEKKIDSFHFYEESSTRFRVMHKSGLVEILEVKGSAQNQVALPVEIHSPSAHKVKLLYGTFNSMHPMLSSITDDAGNTLLSVARDSVSVKVLLHPFSDPSGGPLASFVMTLSASDKRVSRISLPTVNLASWRFDYDFYHNHLCIKSVETPTGAREEIFYQDLGHEFPTSSGRTALPRVTRHVTHPNFAQPSVDVRYTYTPPPPATPNKHNFLGFGLPLTWSGDGLDNLYQHTGAYVYTVVETLWINNQPARTTQRDFNQFHLLTREVTTQNDNVQTVETQYNFTAGKPFDQQPLNCQLPIAHKTTWSLVSNTNTRRSETVNTTYDNFGNLLTQTQANGVVTSSTWHPAALDPEGFVRHLKDETVTPAASPNGQAPTLRTRYTYKPLPPLTGSPLANWLTVDTEILEDMTGTAPTELQRTVFEYTDDSADAFLHGRVKSQTVTLNGKPTVTGYAYSLLSGPVVNESVLQTVETLTGFDHQANVKNVQKIVTLQHSVLTGEPLLNHDDNDVEIKYTYDALRRVKSETVAPGTIYEASRYYEYVLCANTGDQAEQRLIDVKRVQTTSRFDGLNRVIYEERDDADNPIPGSKPRQTYAGTHDAFGNLVKEVEYDWLGAISLALNNDYEYDDWGARRCVTGPDGVKAFEETDPIGTATSQGPIQRSWRESNGANPTVRGVTETWLNLFQKPTQTQRFDLASKQISRHQYLYDGLGRTHKETVGIGTFLRETFYKYDAFDRLIENTLPDQAVVTREFAPHSREDLPTKISVGSKVLGEQTFDGLDRRTQAITGGRVQLFDYAPGQTQPQTVTTPSGEKIEYGYQPNLGDEPILRRLPQVGAKGLFDDATYFYDPHNARLLTCQEQGISLTREYFSTGEQKSEKREVQGEPDRTMNYLYSRLGRLLEYTDVLSQKQTYRYDAEGRLEYTKLGTTESTFTYDVFGLTATIVTSDSTSGQTLGICLTYDEFDREVLRKFDLNGVNQELTQAYNDVDGLTRRTLMEGADVLRDETYEYDPRSRLTIYGCTGTQPPVDPYGKSITGQTFSFDGMDNLKLVLTRFVGGSNRAIYSYDPVDPVQLIKVENDHADYPKLIDLLYNMDGHLIRDEAGRTLKYDVLGRLTSVSNSSGGASRSIHYDPLDKTAAMNDGSGQEQRFYQGDQLANQVKGADSSTFMRGDDVVLAEHQVGAGPKSLLLASDHKASVLSSVSTTGRVGAAYTAYGHRGDAPSGSSATGFNGELCEKATGWYLLGNGNRVFSPWLMKFQSPDDLSPFEQGGLNAYAYCEGDPVNYLDSTGSFRFFHWLGKRLGVGSAPRNTAKHAKPEVSKSGGAGNSSSARLFDEDSMTFSDPKPVSGLARPGEKPMSQATFDFIVKKIEEGDPFGPRNKNNKLPYHIAQFEELPVTAPTPRRPLAIEDAPAPSTSRQLPEEQQMYIRQRKRIKKPKVIDRARRRHYQ